MKVCLETAIHEAPPGSSAGPSPRPTGPCSPLTLGRYSTWEHQSLPDPPLVRSPRWLDAHTTAEPAGNNLDVLSSDSQRIGASVASPDMNDTCQCDQPVMHTINNNTVNAYY